MDGTEGTGHDSPGTAHASLDLDALAVSDRFRLFNFTRRDDHLAYYWVLRAMDRLREVHHLQAHTEDVAQALAELAATHLDVPEIADFAAPHTAAPHPTAPSAAMDPSRAPRPPGPPGSGSLSTATLRDRLDALAEDQMLHRLEDAARAGSLARYRNRQSVYQFSELGYRAYLAVEDVLRARVSDANLSRLVFSDILEDLRALQAATLSSDSDQVHRRLSRLDTVLDDMSRRAAQFHLTLGEIMRSTDTSPDTFLRYKNSLLTHMSDFMAELDRYLPRLAAATGAIDAGPMLALAVRADDRPFLADADKHEDWRRRWTALRAWFADDAPSMGESRAEGLRTATRAAVSGVIALLRQVTEAQRGGVNRSSQLRHLAEWVFNTPDEPAAHALMTAAFNLRTARHLGGAHADADQISSRVTWWDAPGVDISVTLFKRGKAPTPGVPQPARSNPAVKAALARRQAEQRAAERAAARSLLEHGAHRRVLNENETRVLLRLLTLATEARTVVAGRLATAAGGNDVLTMRLVPSAAGSTVQTEHGALHLPGFALELEPAGCATPVSRSGSR
jgi:uncharacterized protein (TIGR02677 family)